MQQPYVRGRYQKEEEIGVERFISLSNHFRNYFSLTAETGFGAVFDIAAEDFTGGTLGIENKVRNKPHDAWDTTIIEPEKMKNLISIWRNHWIQPLYINYWADGHIYIFDIARLSDAGYTNGFEVEWFPNIKWNNPDDGNKYAKSEYRIKIPNRFAIHLDENYRVVNRKEYNELFSKPVVQRRECRINFDDLSKEKINSMIHG